METKVKNKEKTTESTKFGPVENTTETLNFKFGIPGFENLQKFIFQDLKEYPPFKLFRSIEEDDLSMIVLNGKYIQELKDIKIPRVELQKIGAQKQADIKMFVILRIKPATKQFLANTSAPLIINPEKYLGNQIMIEKKDLRPDYPIKVAQK